MGTFVSCCRCSCCRERALATDLFPIGAILYRSGCRRRAFTCHSDQPVTPYVWLVSVPIECSSREHLLLAQNGSLTTSLACVENVGLVQVENLGFKLARLEASFEESKAQCERHAEVGVDSSAANHLLNMQSTTVSPLC